MGIATMILKIIGFGIDMFVADLTSRQALKDSFNKFFAQTAKDSDKSAEMHQSYDRLRKEEAWQKDKN